MSNKPVHSDKNNSQEHVLTSPKDSGTASPVLHSTGPLSGIDPAQTTPGQKGTSKWELKIPAEASKLDQILDFVDKCLEQTGCPEKAKKQIDVAVEELFINIASYAYTPDSGHAVLSVQRSEDPSGVVIELRDSGKPFDPLAKKDPDTTLGSEERGIGGLGIYITKKTMDKVHYRYENEENIITIEKHY